MTGKDAKHIKKGLAMALGSSANTTKISGTNMNTVVIDEWTEWAPAKKAEPAPPVYLDFNTPPLALVIAMQEAGKESYEIYSTLQGVGKRNVNTENVVTVEHQKSAAEIYDYFAKKHTMRRIKGEYVSEYMLAVDDLCENRKRINEEHIKILVSLPRVYTQNRSIERIIKGRKSAPKPNQLHFPPLTAEVEFIDKIRVKMGRSDEYHYFFATPTNYVMRIVVKKGEYGQVAWDTLSTYKKLSIDTDATFTYNIRGYDFNVVQPSPDGINVKILN